MRKRTQTEASGIQPYNFTAEWIKGKKTDAPDTLSCNPVSDSAHLLSLTLMVAEIRTLYSDTTESLHLQRPPLTRPLETH